MLELHVAIHRALPSLSFQSRTVIDALLLSGGSIGPARLVADRLGLRNRFALARQLWRDGLPSLHRLAGWIKVLQWVWQWEHDGVSLNRAATRAGQEPAAYYRIVARVTGESWTAVRSAGFDWVIARLGDEVQNGAEFNLGSPSGSPCDKNTERRAFH